MRRGIAKAKSTGQGTIIVVGPRRSGHHAILAWIANALEEREVSWKDLKPNRVIMSDSGRTVHLNDFRLTRHGSDYINCLKFGRQRRRADNLFVNFEDVNASAVDRLSWIARDAALKVIVTRSTLNLVASRLEMVRTKRNPHSFPVNAPFLEVLKAHRSVPAGWIPVHFDAWLEDREGYRAEIALKCGIRHDIDPMMSTFGKGSSFTGVGEKPTASTLTKRYAQVSWPEDVVELLLRDEYSELLTRTERDFLESLPTVRSRSAWL